MEKIEEKIEYHIDLKEISQELCENYRLGKYKEYALINTGLEDLNYCLVTEEGKKYLIKIFNKNRSKEQLIDYIEKHKILEKTK